MCVRLYVYMWVEIMRITKLIKRSASLPLWRKKEQIQLLIAINTNSNQVIWELYALNMSCNFKCEDNLNRTVRQTANQGKTF